MVEKIRIVIVLKYLLLKMYIHAKVNFGGGETILKFQNRIWKMKYLWHIVIQNCYTIDEELEF